jgi:Ca-activated chloride channel homolog
LATLWARTRVDDLMSQDFNGAQQGNMKPDVQQAITQLGLDYRLMTQFTSFVAVEEMVVTDGGQPRRIDVPVEVPEGVNRGAVFGDDKENFRFANRSMSGMLMSASGTLSQTVSVSAAPARIDTSKSSVTTELDESIINPSAANREGRQPKAKPAGVGGGRDYSPEERRRQEIANKVHPAVLAVIDRLKDKRATPGADEAKFVHNGKAEIQIWLNEKNDEAIAKLKELGFEIVLDPKTAKLVIGRLPIEKLAALADLKAVRYVAPQMSN